jgi:hypothetical protein
VINGSGEPVVGDFWKIVESEHCRSPDSSEPFLTSNYGITTTPAQEWEITTKQNASLADMRHDRRLPNPEDLLQSDLSKRAGLTLIEVVVLVLYTGPMVSRARVIMPLSPLHPAHTKSKPVFPRQLSLPLCAASFPDAALISRSCRAAAVRAV